jgi:hypothetical protein
MRGLGEAKRKEKEKCQDKEKGKTADITNEL